MHLPLYPPVTPPVELTGASSGGSQVQPPQEAATPWERSEAVQDTRGTPMDTGGVGEPSSLRGRGTQAERDGIARKCRRFQSRWPEARPVLPFPLQDYPERVNAVRQLYQQAAEHGLASHQTATNGLKLYHPKMELDDLTSLNNQVLLMIAEYHLTCASQGTHRVTPLVPGTQHSCCLS